MARKPLLLLALDAAALLPGIFVPGIRTALWTLLVPTLLLVTLIVTLLWPSGGMRGYFSYRTPLVVAAFVAELFIIAGGLALRLPSSPRTSAWWFQGFLVVFFLLTSINSLPGLTGEYRSGVSLRPDLIFGAGAYLVRGEIFVALGIEFLTTRALAHPVWNWWAVVAEIMAMLIVIALRGILKMHMRRARLLGIDSWLGAGLRSGLWVRETFLYLALFFVVYAFANMYLGRIPFTWPPGEGHGGPGWWGLASLAGAFVVLVPLRGRLKARLPEPPTLPQELAKQLLLWAGLALLVYGFLVLFDGRIRQVHYGGYFNFWWGMWVSALGFVMIVPLRALALREEFRGTIKIMTASLAEVPDNPRQEMLTRRLRTVAALGERERRIHLGLMIAGVESQPPQQRERIQHTRQTVLEGLPPGLRERLESTSGELRAKAAGERPEARARKAMR